MSIKAELIQDSVYPEMFRIKWSDGKISDMVNKTRAKDAVARLRTEIQSSVHFKRPPRASRKPVGAFK